MEEKIDWYHPTPEQIAAEVNRRKFAPEEPYKAILEYGVVSSPDTILVRSYGGVVQFGLARRTAVPWKGEFCLFGREIKPSCEELSYWVKLTCQKELGFEPADEDIAFIGHQMVLNPERTGYPHPWWSLWHIHTVFVYEDTPIKLRDDNSDLQWFSCIQPNFIEPVKKALRMAGFSE
ncbi:MAG: hypothetical protein KGJ13_08010 [Patescibacteria group bacterium]|nr:hypothetical protein [Patescibacteria group bacterium]